MWALFVLDFWSMHVEKGETDYTDKYIYARSKNDELILTGKIYGIIVKIVSL